MMGIWEYNVITNIRGGMAMLAIKRYLVLGALTIAMATVVMAEEKSQKIVTADGDTITVSGVVDTKSVIVPEEITDGESDSVEVSVLEGSGALQGYSSTGFSEFNIVSYNDSFEIVNVEVMENAELADSDAEYDIISPYTTKEENANNYTYYAINKLVVNNYGSSNTESFYFVVESNNKAVESSQKVIIDGSVTDCDIYNINGSNYLKIRDLAQLLKNTDAKFNVWYDKASNTVEIKNGRDYKSIGDELSKSEDKGTVNAKENNMGLKVDGENISAESYNINGYTYYKLRDLSASMGFGVEYNSENNTVNVTSKSL